MQLLQNKCPQVVDVGSRIALVQIVQERAEDPLSGASVLARSVASRDRSRERFRAVRLDASAGGFGARFTCKISNASSSLDLSSKERTGTPFRTSTTSRAGFDGALSEDAADSLLSGR